MLLLESCAEDGVLPVCTLAEKRGIREIGIGFSLSVGDKVVEILGIFTQVHDVETFVLTLPGNHAVVGEFCFTGFTAFGSDEHDAVGALSTVDGCRGGVLEDFHRHDVGGVDGREGRHRSDVAVTESIAKS